MSPRQPSASAGASFLMCFRRNKDVVQESGSIINWISAQQQAHTWYKCSNLSLGDFPKPSSASSSQPGQDSLPTHLQLTPAWRSCTANTLLHMHLSWKESTSQRCCSYLRPPFPPLGGCRLSQWKRWFNRNTSRPLEDGCGGRMLSPLKTFPSQGRERHLDVLQTHPGSAGRPMSCHLSDSQRQDKLCPY